MILNVLWAHHDRITKLVWIAKWNIQVQYCFSFQSLHLWLVIVQRSILLQRVFKDHSECISKGLQPPPADRPFHSCMFEGWREVIQISTTSQCGNRAVHWHAVTFGELGLMRDCVHRKLERPVEVMKTFCQWNNTPSSGSTLQRVESITLSHTTLRGKRQTWSQLWTEKLFPSFIANINTGSVTPQQ